MENICLVVQAGADRTREPLQECLDLAFQHPESVHAVGLAAEAVQTGLVKLSPQQHQVRSPRLARAVTSCRHGIHPQYCRPSAFGGTGAASMEEQDGECVSYKRMGSSWHGRW